MIRNCNIPNPYLQEMNNPNYDVKVDSKTNVLYKELSQQIKNSRNGHTMKSKQPANIILTSR